MDFSSMIDDSHLSYFVKRINKEDIPAVEKLLKVKIGKQLEEYLLDYGHITYENIEFFGIKKKQMKKSDMITKTQWLHNNFYLTKDLIVFEEQEEGEYYMVDSKDNIFCFITDSNKLIKLDIDLYDYIIKRFNQIAATIRY